MALGVPQGAPLLAVRALVHLSGTTTISIGLVAVSSIVAEALVVWAILPADRPNTAIVRLTEWVAKRTILLAVLGASGEGLASSAS